MSLYFIINNFVFAFGMVGAIVFIMAAWLSFDAYRLRPDPFILARTIGFSFVAIWHLIAALVSGNDVMSFVGAVIFGLGLACIIASFLKRSELLAHAIIVVPSFSLFSRYIYLVAAAGLALIAWLGLRQWRREHNPTWAPLVWSFALMAAGSVCAGLAPVGSTSHPLFLSKLVLEIAGFIILGYWVWQYMRLRINESVMMISVGVTFLLATIVTLAFSTILIGRVTAETARNLITDVRVLDMSITSLRGEAMAKSALVASDPDIVAAMTKGDDQAVYQLAEKSLLEYELGFLTIVSPDGEVVVRANALSRRGDSVTDERAFEEASLKKRFVTVATSPVEGLSIRAGAPILADGKLVGIVIAGYQLDNAFVDGMKKVTGLEMFVYAGDTSVSGTAFASDGTRRLVGIKPSSPSVVADVLGEGKIVTANIEMYGEPFQASYAPIVDEDGKIVGMLSAAKHQQDVVNIANATNRLTLITVILILLLLLAPIYALAKRLSQDAQVL